MRCSPTVFALAVALLTGSTACTAPTHLTAVWRAPDLTSLRFKKIFVAAQSRDQARRRAIETYLVGRIHDATPSYTLLSEADARSPDRAKAIVATNGFDGAVVVRFVGTTQQTTYVPGAAYWGPAPYPSMWGYWGYGWGAVYEPGYLQSDTVVTLESNVYDVHREALVWSSRSDTISPGSIDELMRSVVDATVKEMKRQRVL
jgi:hypothetical protein